MSGAQTAEVMDGRRVARVVLAALTGQVAQIARDRGRPPGLALVQVGASPASTVYVDRKQAAAARLGLLSRVIRLPAEISMAALLAEVEALNQDAAIDAFLVQLPLPGHLAAAVVTQAIAPDKDADGLHPTHIGQLVAGVARRMPCTPAGVMALLAHYRVPLTGAHAVVVGRSAIVGRPLAAMLLRAHATVTHCHRHTRDLAALVGLADVLVVAAGQPSLVHGSWLKAGAVVVDVGITRLGGVLVGDVEAESARRRARLLTPVPGGVGPMTVAMLMHNAVAAAGESWRRQGR